MTLAEAYAQYAIERDSILNELHPYAGDYPGTSIAWHRERDRLALDDVVKAAMLAAVDRAVDIAEEDILGPQDAADGVVAEIEREFGAKGDEGDERTIPRRV